MRVSQRLRQAVPLILVLGMTGSRAHSQSPAQGESAPPTRTVTAKLDDGRTFSGALQGEPPAFHVRPAGPEIPAARLREVRFPEPAFPFGPSPPLRRVTLRGGDRLAADVLAIGPDEAQLKAFHRAPAGKPVALRLPRAALASVRERPRHALWIYDGCEGESTAWTSSPGPLPLDEKAAANGRRGLRIDPLARTMTCALPGTIEQGVLELGLFDPGTVDARWEWAIEFGFGTGSPARDQAGAARVEPRTLEVVSGWTDAQVLVRSPGGPLAVQPLRRRAGWRVLRLALTGGQMQLELDGAVLAQGDRPAGGLQTLRVIVRPTAATGTGPAPAPAALDDLKAYRAVGSAVGSLGRQPEQDVLTLPSGDEIYGVLKHWSGAEVRASGSFGEATFAPRDIRSLELRGERPRQASVTGWRVRVWLRSPEPAEDAGEGNESRGALDRLTGALVSANDAELALDHPWLGRVPIPMERVERIETLGQGTRWELDPRFHHLGNDPRRDFPAVAPEGPDLAVDFDWDGKAATVWLCLDLLDLESFDSRHALALKAGHLATSVLVNDRLLEGTLNRHVQQSRERVRLPLPAGMLKPGANRILIHAKPAEDDPRELDDFGVEGVALEAAP